MSIHVVLAQVGGINRVQITSGSEENGQLVGRNVA
jgi:hypothetical protein